MRKPYLPRRNPSMDGGGERWDRTSDTGIFSPLLYLLS